jgi:cytochrome c-type biogenesis protein CcmE
VDVTTPELDLAPRTGPEPGDTGGRARRRSRARGVGVALVIVGLLGAMGFVLVRQLEGSSIYYYNVDEAVEQREDIGDRNIRIQGNVVGEPVEHEDDTVTFRVAFRGQHVDVRHVANEPVPRLFGAGVPAVLEGHFDDDGTFVSERIVIKHSEEYREKNSDRVPDDAP